MIASQIEARLRDGVQRGLRRGALALVGGLALVVAAGFATAAGWIALAAAYGALVAALALAGAYGVVGLAVLAAAIRGGATFAAPECPQETERPSDAAPEDPLARVAAAFSEGYAAGQALRGRSDKTTPR